MTMFPSPLAGKLPQSSLASFLVSSSNITVYKWDIQRIYVSIFNMCRDISKTIFNLYDHIMSCKY